MENLKEIKNQMLEYSENNPDYSKRALILDTVDSVVKSYESRNCFNCDNYGNQFDCAIKYIHHIVPDTFCCNKWEELL